MFLIWLNVISAGLIVILFLSIMIFDKKNVKSELQNLKLITMAAILVALATVLNQISTRVLSNAITAKVFQVRIGDFALILTGFCCGGGIGSLSGIAADFLNLIFGVNGTPNLFYTLTSMVWCVLPLYLMRFCLTIYQSKYTIYFYFFVTYGLTLALISFWNPIIISNLYDIKNGIWPLYLTRIIAFPINLFFNSCLLILAYRSLHQLLALKQRLGIRSNFEKKNDKINLVQKQTGVIND